jgi:drug/metabolite transporter (DMT)-like permease
MSWLFYAFSGPVLWALSTHLDKFLVERYFKTSEVAVLLIFTALAGLLALPFIWAWRPEVGALDAGSIALIMLSGILYMGAMLFYLRALQSEEASAVAPFFQAAPLFGYLFAYVVLGEALSAVQMAGGGMIIAGAMVVAIKFGADARRFNARLAALMLACACALALSALIFKVFMLQAEFWTATFWTFAGEAVFGGALLIIPALRRQLVAMLRQNTTALLAINGANELINLGGGIGNRYALMFAPLSIVQAIGSTTTLFVFAFGVVFSALFPRLSREELSAGELARKGVAAVLVVAGVILVNR